MSTNTPKLPAKSTAPMDRIATALASIDIHAPSDGCTTWDQYARVIETAARNLSAGRRDALASRDDDFTPDPNPPAEVWYGGASGV